MHRAAGNKSSDVAELLIRSGADVNAKDNVGITGVDYVIQYMCNTSCITNITICYNYHMLMLDLDIVSMYNRMKILHCIGLLGETALMSLSY